MKIHSFSCSLLLYKKFRALAYTFPFYKWYMKSKLQAFLEETKPKVIHCHDIEIADTLFSASAGRDYRVFLDLHEKPLLGFSN